jgi:hypothetical protein
MGLVWGSNILCTCDGWFEQVLGKHCMQRLCSGPCFGAQGQACGGWGNNFCPESELQKPFSSTIERVYERYANLPRTPPRAMNRRKRKIFGLQVEKYESNRNSIARPRRRLWSKFCLGSPVTNVFHSSHRLFEASVHGNRFLKSNSPRYWSI